MADTTSRPTQLPLFSTIRALETSTYHDATARVTAAGLQDTDGLLQRFAQFVGAVAGERAPVFSAYISNEEYLVHVTQGAIMKTKTAGDKGGFCIYIGEKAEKEQPLVLSVVTSGDVCDVTLSLRGDYGPAAAAESLLQLAVAYVDADEGPEKAPISEIRTGDVAVESDGPQLLHEILEQSARAHPDSIAMDEITGVDVNGGYVRRQMTYGQMQAQVEEWAEQIGQVLEQLQWPALLGEQRMVPLFVSTGAEMMLLMNAIPRAGHCFCILQLDAPEGRLREQLADLNAPGMVGVGANPWQGTPFGEEVVWIDCLDMKSLDLDTKSLLRVSTTDDVAYMVYTSGSTGKPKGIPARHSMAMAFVRAYDASPGRFEGGQQLRYMVLSSPTFDLLLLDDFMPLLKGGTLCLAARSLLLTDPEAVIDALQASATFTVSSLAMLLRPARMPSLRTLCVGGELLRQRVLDNFAGRRLLNLYGPTETTVFVTLHTCDATARPSVIGAPYPSVQAVLLDQNSKEIRAVPLGVPGELALGGPQLAAGYHNRPAETAQAFVQSPALGPLYRTGDMARIVWTADGRRALDYLGRIHGDGQVKLNGRRVELAEIENVLARAPDAAQVAVFIHHRNGTQSLHACVMPWQGRPTAALEEQCREQAASFLPAWMRPMQYTAMETFPVNSSGKINRKVLKKMVTGPKVEVKKVQAEKVEKKESDTASIVYRRLTDVLGPQAQLVHAASLPALGMDSLRTISFLQLLREDGITGLEMHNVLTSTTIGELVDVVEAKRSGDSDSDSAIDVSGKAVEVCEKVDKAEVFADGIDVSAVPIQDDETIFEMPLAAKLRHFEHHCRPACLKALGLDTHQVEQVLPVTNVQARFVAMAVDPVAFDHSRYTGRPHVEHFAYRVPPDMDPARLQRAVDAVLAQHDCFRTVFVPIEHPLALFAQCVLSPAIGRVPRVEIVCDDTDADVPDGLWVASILGAERAAEAAMRIDRVGAVSTWVWSPDRARCVWALSLFHGIYDGAQLTLLRGAIAAEYERLGTSEKKARADLPTLLPLRRAVELNLGEDWLATMMYWARRVVGVPGFRVGGRRPLPIKGDLPGSYTGVEATHMRNLKVKASLSMRQLVAATSAMGMPLLSVVEAAWASVLAQTFEDREKTIDLQFGTVMSGRHRHRDAASCMAPMLAAMPMRLVFAAGKPRPSNRQVCTDLMALRAEATPFLQIPCPSMAHARGGANRMDSILLVQALRADVVGDGRLHDLPGYNWEQNLMAPYKELDIGYPMAIELWPGRMTWDDKILLRCMYNIRRPGYEFLDRDWVHGALSALDEAIVRITSEPDAPFYVG